MLLIGGGVDVVDDQAVLLWGSMVVRAASALFGGLI
jgi:hypothetical protein